MTLNPFNSFFSRVKVKELAGFDSQEGNIKAGGDIPRDMRDPSFPGPPNGR
jgi:hypothetical protein